MSHGQRRQGNVLSSSCWTRTEPNDLVHHEKLPNDLLHGQWCKVFRAQEVFIRRRILSPLWWSNDSFRIRCDVTVVKDIRVETTVTNSGDEPPSPDLGQNLGELLDSQLGADVEFMVGDEVFMAHRIVLAARSSVFKAELYGQMKEKVQDDVHTDR
ncbi:hypothetical protein HU200_044064 [Digitaria exilis]|uniref:BTB domain-containing protein n=1 Tax=Digitaria exilis TaxID=1010633 RepID=A0A835AZL6_9POAL|nr:hypothetical protein HU200_044064 [Digitaria exilis]